MVFITHVVVLIAVGNRWTEIKGFANISAFHNNTPIFLSNPHFFGCDDKWGKKMTGVLENQNWETDITVIDIEPWTGQTLHVNKSTQLNVYIPENSTQFNLFNPNVTKGLFYPIVRVARRLAVVTCRSCGLQICT